VLEAELVHRARLLEAEDLPDVASHRRQHPDDPLPALVLVTGDVSAAQGGRLRSGSGTGPPSATSDRPCARPPGPRSSRPSSAWPALPGRPGAVRRRLWQFQAASATARRADLDTAVATALTQAGEACGGDLLESTPYGWVEIPREDTRRQAVDALARLAELRQATGDPEGALVALEQAIAADPVAEELYRRLMRPLTEAGSAGATVDSRHRPGLLATH
jgi:Bacterial transcriptional activator domain